MSNPSIAEVIQHLEDNGMPLAADRIRQLESELVGEKELRAEEIAEFNAGVEDFQKGIAIHDLEDSPHDCRAIGWVWAAHGSTPRPEARCREALTDVLRPIYDHRHQKTGDTVRDLQILIAGLHAAIQKHTAVIDSLDLSSTPRGER